MTEPLVSRFCVHTFKNLEDIPNDLKTEYSKFKYGDLRLAKKFARELFSSFMKVSGSFDMKKVVITSSPYKYIPPTAMNLSKYFRDCINKTEFGPFPLIKTNRNFLFEGDYGKLSEHERLELMSKDFISIDETIIKDKTLICIDDIRITDSHEKKMENLLLKTGIKELIFLYYMDYNSEDKDPTIEDRINHFYIKDITSINDMMVNNDIAINARLCKYLLSYPDKKKLLDFLEKRNYKYIELLYNSCIGDGYNKMETYKVNFDIIFSLYKLLAIKNGDL